MNDLPPTDKRLFTPSYLVAGEWISPTAGERIAVTNPADASAIAAVRSLGLAPVIPFAGEADVIGKANDTEFGLDAYINSRHLVRMFRAVEARESGGGLNSGMIASETALFGGSRQSGLGREGSKYGTEAYLVTTYSCAVRL